ncbi:hypothetical protein HPB50_016233 [Hyalomma asiaticum]|uniref:Uncharacterized protein n=1 Tax=Hyalomma asiaticum TaxID=266040 RepID=A0ACB7TQ10_HYAAI|nr:hypothetical protein HPB50_016233 [Hyalomma asiaticum]
MACSVDSVSAAASGRGVGGCSLPAGYKLLLPTLPSDETMKLCVFLHCDVGGRPYRIEDFRSPLEELGVLKAMSGIGPYQMSHVWMLKLRSQEEKNLLISSGGLKVKGRYCAVIDPVKQELTVKIHWVAFDVPNEAIRSVLSEYGDVKDVKQEEWSVPGFEQAESTTRVVRMILRKGITADELPDLCKLQGGAVLVVVPGRAPKCLRCRMKGHIRRDCRTPRCTKCRAFGHERQDCVRTYAAVIGATASHQEIRDLMDEVEAEEAASPSVKEIEANHDTTGCTAGTPPASQHLEERRCETVADGCAETAQSEDSPAPRSGTRPKKTRPKVLTGERESTEIDGGASFELTEQGKEANKLEEACLGASAEMDVDPALLKRRHEEDDGVKERVQRELQPVWKVVTGKKGKYVPRTRAASLTRDARSDE